jgi:integrase-like protein
MGTLSGGGRPPDTRATGQVLTYKRKDGLTSWYLRVRDHGSRHRIKLGTELDGWTQARARIELQNVLARIQAGLWEPPTPQATSLDDPSFHQFASSWLARRRPSYKKRTYEHYRYFLTDHLLPAFASLRLSQWTTRRSIATWRQSNSRARRFERRPVAACRSPMPTAVPSARWRTPRSTRRSSSWRGSSTKRSGASCWSSTPHGRRACV